MSQEFEKNFIDEDEVVDQAKEDPFINRICWVNYWTNLSTLNCQPRVP